MLVPTLAYVDVRVSVVPVVRIDVVFRTVTGQVCFIERRRRDDSAAARQSSAVAHTADDASAHREIAVCTATHCDAPFVSKFSCPVSSPGPEQIRLQ
jgi:hypothetical protein